MSYRPPPQEAPPPFGVRLLVSTLISFGALLLAGGAYLVTANDIAAGATFLVGWIILQMFLRDLLTGILHPSNSRRPPRRRR